MEAYLTAAYLFSDLQSCTYYLNLADILAIDNNNNYVVIELKVSKGYDRVIGQLLRYMAWIETNQAEPTQKVRGIIIAREISEDLHLAASKILEVELFEYDLSVSLRNVDKQKGNSA